MKIINDLYLQAEQAMKNSYSPHSNFKVGASLGTKDNRNFTGTNIENISYGLGICAERVAIFNAVSKGHKDFTDMAIVTSSQKTTYPCGACRQVMMEFSPNLKIHLKGKIKTTIRLTRILPNSFNSNQMC